MTPHNFASINGLVRLLFHISSLSVERVARGWSSIDLIFDYSVIPGTVVQSKIYSVEITETDVSIFLAGKLYP